MRSLRGCLVNPLSVVMRLWNLCPGIQTWGCGSLPWRQVTSLGGWRTPPPNPGAPEVMHLLFHSPFLTRAYFQNTETRKFVADWKIYTYTIYTHARTCTSHNHMHITQSHTHNAHTVMTCYPRHSTVNWTHRYCVFRVLKWHYFSQHHSPNIISFCKPSKQSGLKFLLKIMFKRYFSLSMKRHMITV